MIIIDSVKEIEEEKVYTIEDIVKLPDGVRAELINGEIFYMAPPSWTHQRISRELFFEIVSPSSKPRDYIKKMFLYNTAGVREYWIVDPEEKIVTIYGFECGTMKQYAFGDNVPVGIYDDFSIKVEL